MEEEEDHEDEGHEVVCCFEEFVVPVSNKGKLLATVSSLWKGNVPDPRNRHECQPSLRYKCDHTCHPDSAFAPRCNKIAFPGVEDNERKGVD